MQAVGVRDSGMTLALSFIAAVAFLLLTAIMLIAANFSPVFTYGYGTRASSVGIWKSCYVNANGYQNCYYIAAGGPCAETDYRMKAVGAFDMVGVLSSCSMVVAFVFEGLMRRKLPMDRLTLILAGWLFVAIAAGIVVMATAYVALLCSAPLSIQSQNGDFGDAFYFFFYAFFTACMGAASYAYYIRSARGPLDPSLLTIDVPRPPHRGYKNSNSDTDDEAE